MEVESVAEGINRQLILGDISLSTQAVDELILWGKTCLLDLPAEPPFLAIDYFLIYEVYVPNWWLSLFNTKGRAAS